MPRTAFYHHFIINVLMENIPVEIQARILSNLSDPFTLYHVERVCPLWREIVHFLKQARGLKFRHIKVL